MPQSLEHVFSRHDLGKRSSVVQFFDPGIVVNPDLLHNRPLASVRNKGRSLGPDRQLQGRTGRSDCKRFTTGGYISKG